LEEEEVSELNVSDVPVSIRIEVSMLVMSGAVSIGTLPMNVSLGELPEFLQKLQAKLVELAEGK
jgi:hypothetical protein